MQDFGNRVIANGRDNQSRLAAYYQEMDTAATEILAANNIEVTQQAKDSLIKLALHIANEVTARAGNRVNTGLVPPAR